MAQTKQNKKEWAIKFEDLDYTEKYAEQVEAVLYNFLTDDIDYMTTEWIEPISCRRYDGFIPYSNNKGGFQARTYRGQLDFYFEPTGFEAFDKACLYTYNYLTECYLEDNKISDKDYQKGLANDDPDMINLRDEIEQGYSDYDEACFETMLKLEDNNTLFVSFMPKASDAPYFRGYHHSIDFEVKFTNIFELKKELNKILDDKRVQNFIDIVNH